MTDAWVQDLRDSYQVEKGMLLKDIDTLNKAFRDASSCDNHVPVGSNSGNSLHNSADDGVDLDTEEPHHSRESSPAMSVSTTVILVTSKETMPVTTVSAVMPSMSGVITTSIAPVVPHSVFGHGVSNPTAVVSAAETTKLASTVVGTERTTTSTHVVSAMDNCSISIYSGN